MSKPFQLIVTDIDNTLFDWVEYYTSAYGSLLQKLAKITRIPYEQLAKESSEVFARHGSIEYPFVVQELPSVNALYEHDVDRLLLEAVAPARIAFMDAASKHLVPYPEVSNALARIKILFPEIPVVALTDAPRYVAMWKLNKLGLLHGIDAVYGLADPRIPTDEVQGRVKVEPKILLKHLQQFNFEYTGKIRTLPDEYEKPGTRGLKTVLMDYNLDEASADRKSVLWIGDNVRKDVGLGHRLGVTTCWAQYGAKVSQEALQKLHQFSPEANIHKNANVTSLEADTPKPDFILEKSFAEITDVIAAGCQVG